jgi:hypothetical protein
MAARPVKQIASERRFTNELLLHPFFKKVTGKPLRSAARWCS